MSKDPALSLFFLFLSSFLLLFFSTPPHGKRELKAKKEEKVQKKRKPKKTLHQKKKRIQRKPTIFFFCLFIINSLQEGIYFPRNLQKNLSVIGSKNLHEILLPCKNIKNQENINCLEPPCKFFSTFHILVVVILFSQEMSDPKQAYPYPSPQYPPQAYQPYPAQGM